MVEDIDEVRMIALRLAEFGSMMLNSPIGLMLFDEASYLDITFHIATVISMLRPTTQAEFNRLCGMLLGKDPGSVEELIREHNLSETLPVTHPDVPVPEIEQLDPHDPVVQKSRVLSEIMRRQQEQVDVREQQPRVDQPVELSASLDAFLKSMEGYSRPAEHLFKESLDSTEKPEAEDSTPEREGE